MSRLARVILACGLLTAAVLYVLAVTPYIGVAYDDGRYVTLAQALAKGAGYSQIYAPDHPPEPQYPPGWPLILSAWWLVAPNFPANAIGFKLISALCALAFAGSSYGWMRWRGEGTTPSLLVALLTLFNPLVFGLATSAFSEMAYAFFSVVALWLVEKYARAETARWRSAVLPSLAAAWAMYIRSLGIVLVVAAVVHLLSQPNRRKAFVFAALCLVWVAPWIIRGAMLPRDVWGYSQQFMLRSMEQPELGTIGWGDLVVRVILNVKAYLLAGLPGAILPSQVPLTFVNLAEGLRVGAPFPGSDIVLAMVVAGALISRAVFRRALLDVYIVLYLGMAILWPWEPTRFVIPLIPFLYEYVLFEAGLFVTAFAGHPATSRTLQVAALALVTLFLVANFAAQAQVGLETRQSVELSPDWAARFRLYDWIRQNTPETSVFASLDNAQLYLYTGRQVIRSLGSAAALSQYGVEYLVLVPYGGVMVSGDMSRIQFDPLYNRNPSAFRPVYEDAGAGIQVFQVSLEALK